MNVATLSGKILRDSIDMGVSQNGKSYLKFKAEITRSRGSDVLNFIVWEPFDKTFFNDYCHSETMKVDLQCSIRAMGDKVILRVEQYEFEESQDSGILSDNAIKQLSIDLKKKWDYPAVLKKIVNRTGDTHADELGNKIVISLIRSAEKSDYINEIVKKLDNLQFSCLFMRFYDSGLKRREVKNFEPYVYACLKSMREESNEDFSS